MDVTAADLSVASFVVQVAGVVASVFGTLTALTIAVRGNRAADRRAQDDRREARAAAQDRLDLEMLLRLAQNLQKGGAKDPEEVARMGAEVRSLLGALGPDGLPLTYAKYAGMTATDLRAWAADDSRPEWKRYANEVVAALQERSEAQRDSEVR